MTAFEEAVTCYKANANRAALLFSYLGFNLTLRSRILAAARPEDVPEGEWKNQIQANLKKESSWDKTVFDCVNRTNRRVFDIPDDVRRQVEYWKDRRNDCAHYKRNEISAAHVESFWGFVRSQLNHIVPHGSRADALNRIQDFFDRSITPPDTPIEPLVRRIAESVRARERTDFFDDVYSVFTDDKGRLLGSERRNLTTLYGAILDSSDDSLRDALLEHLSAHPRSLVLVLRARPKRVSALNGRSTLIRKLWRKHLFSGDSDDLALFSWFLRSGLVPDSQVGEAIDHVIPRLRSSTPSDDTVQELRNVNFWSQFEAYGFERTKIDDFDWGKPNADLIRWYVANHPISEEMARAIVTVGQPPYPFEVHRVMCELFEESSDKLTEFREVCNEHDIRVPDGIFSADAN
jgi:hypothetical protein